MTQNNDHLSARSRNSFLLLWILLISCTLNILAQQSDSAADVVRPRISAVPGAARYSSRASEVLRVINDPGGHAVWLLTADPVHPSGPGRLERVSMSSTTQKKAIDEPSPSLDIAELRTSQTNVMNSKSARNESSPVNSVPNLTPVIRAGDHILLEQHTAALDSTLSGIALGPARAGESFEARLTVGGKPLHAVALSSGHALIVAQLEFSAFGGSE